MDWRECGGQLRGKRASAEGDVAWARRKAGDKEEKGWRHPEHKCQGHTLKVMLRFLTRATKWTMVPSVKIGTVGIKQMAGGRVKVGLENTEFEELRGLELRGALWLKER